MKQKLSRIILKFKIMIYKFWKDFLFFIVQLFTEIKLYQKT